MKVMELCDLAQKPQLRESVLALMQAEFPQGEKQSSLLPFDEEFAALLKDNAPERILFCLDEGQSPVAALAWKPFTLKQGLKIAALGLVVTRGDHRKRGLSRKLVLEAETRAVAQGAALMCLWSDLLEFYTKLGYVLASSEISWDLTQIDDVEELAISENLPADAIRALSLSDVSELQKVYASEAMGPERETRVFERQLAQSDSLALAHVSDAKILAYALAGKGRDLRNVIHELVGEPASFPALLTATRAELLRRSDSAQMPVRLQFPYSHPVQPDLEALFASGEQGAVCFAKILLIEKFIDALNLELVAQDFAELRIRYLRDINAWALSDKTQDIFLSPDPAHLLQIFCQPWELSELEGLPGRTLKRLEGWRPYPLYFWGSDGV
jgi:predicted N-acetyltransferase YhbS